MLCVCYMKEILCMDAQIYKFQYINVINSMEVELVYGLLCIVDVL